MTKRDSLIHKISTALFSAMMLMGVGMYIFNYDNVLEIYKNIQFPSFLIYFLATAKLSGVAALWLAKSPRLKEWAYAGFTFILILATCAHINIADNEYFGPIIGLILLGTSYLFYSKTLKTATV